MYVFPVRDACVHAQTAGSVNIPAVNSVVHRDECAYCCRTCKVQEGVFVCMICFAGFCQNHISKHIEVEPKHFLYTQIFEMCEESECDKNIHEVFDVKNLGVVKEKKYVTHICCALCAVTLETIPSNVELSYNAIINSSLPGVNDSNSKVDNFSGWEKESCIHVKELEQLPTECTYNSPELENKCSIADCGIITNNWMCMTCGFVSCARPEVGGQGHALQHYAETGHPCAVKLGTITISGADIYCYACDDECYDDDLMKHMKHFGIDITTAKKTAKTMNELEYDYSSQFDFNKITEADEKLVSAYGPGRTGIINIGNSCYLASILQSFFSLSYFKEAFYANGKCLHQETCQMNPYFCWHCQIERIASGLLSGEFSCADDVDDKDRCRQHGISPRLFKHVFAAKHLDFSSSQQQDAQEYLSYLVDQLEQHIFLPQEQMHPSQSFYFLTEYRMECSNCHEINIQREKNLFLQLNLPKEIIENARNAYVEEHSEFAGNDNNTVERSRPRCTLEDCLNETLKEVQEIECRCEHCNQCTRYNRTMSLNTFPEILIICLQRTQFDLSSMSVKKMNVFVDVAENIDLNMYRSTSEKKHESDESTKFVVLPSEKAGSEIMCKKAHEPNLYDDNFSCNDVALMSLVNMGIKVEVAYYALLRSNMNIDQAIDYIFSHPHIEEEIESGRHGTNIDVNTQNTDKMEVRTDGNGRYELVAMISHMGASARTGHYVCHIKEDVSGKWLLFNDEKVGLSHNPPFAMASIYFFRRKT